MHEQKPKQPVSLNEQASLPVGAEVKVLSEQFSGPIPSPMMLEKYERVLPGMAERIVRMAELEQQKRLDIAQQETKQKAEIILITKQESQASINAQRKGQSIGLCVVIASIVCAMFCAYNGYDWRICVAFLAVPTASFISAFIPSRNKPNKE